MSFLLLLACTTPAETPALRFTAIPDHDTRLLEQRFQPVAAYLSEALQVEVVYVPAADYRASVELFTHGDIQLAWFGGLTGVQARAAVPGAHAIAQGAEDPEYHSYFIAHQSTGLTRSEDFPTALSALTFTFGSESSTSGRLMPEHFLRQASGKGPEAFFEQPYAFSGAHDRTAKLVESGQVQAGALNFKTYDAMVADGRLDASQAPIIWKTPAFADYNFTAHPVLDARYGEGFTAKLQQALIAMDDPALLQAFDRSALISAKDEDFAAIASVAAELGMVQ